MKTESSDVGKYRLVRIFEDLSNESDLTAFKTAIKPHLDEGVRHLALSFTEKTVFFSRTIAIIVQFLGHIKEIDGTLTIIHPNGKILEMIHLVGLAKLIDTCTSEADLRSQSKYVPFEIET